MRLIYLIPLMSTVGGIERTVIDKANDMVDRGHEVMIVTYEHEGPLAYQLNPKILHKDLNCHFFAIYKYPFLLRIPKAIEMKSLFRKRMQDILSEFNPNLIVITIPNTENFICDLMAVAEDIPVIVESHLAQGYQVIKRGVTETWLYHFFKPLNAIRKAKLLISLTKGDAECWHRQNVQRIKVVPNPVTFYPEQLPMIEKTKGRIICVGRLTSQKRFDRLMDAFSMIEAKFPLWHVDIFGDGEDKEILMKKIVEKGLVGRIHVHSATRDIYIEYQRSQFLVLCSDFEGFGLVIVEAMACGIPVVATDCPYGPSEIVEDGKTGLLCKMNVRDLAEKMEWMLTHEEERTSMGMKAYQSAAQYRKDIVMDLWESAYLSVI